MATAGRGPSLPWFIVFKAAVFILLACNAAVYMAAGTLSEAIDTMAWLALLVSFELETVAGGLSRAKSHAIRATRLIAAAAIATAAFGYVRESEWLDAVNTLLWIAVVVLLEFEVRYPDRVRQRKRWITATATVLYTALAALIPIWAWRGEWLDAYDALLWLTAFAIIEMDVLGFSRRAAMQETSGTA